jgi:hypothetical protein
MIENETETIVDLITNKNSYKKTFRLSFHANHCVELRVKVLMVHSYVKMVLLRLDHQLFVVRRSASSIPNSSNKNKYQVFLWKFQFHFHSIPTRSLGSFCERTDLFLSWALLQHKGLKYIFLEFFPAQKEFIETCSYYQKGNSRYIKNVWSRRKCEVKGIATKH